MNLKVFIIYTFVIRKLNHVTSIMILFQIRNMSIVQFFTQNHHIMC